MSSSEASDPKSPMYKSAAKARRARKTPADIAKPAMPYFPETRHAEEAVARNVDGLNSAFTGSGLMVPGLFNATLWAYTARLDAMKRGAGMCSVKGNLGDRDMMDRHIKAISLNPSVHGNVYGVLGSS
jgi:hypothetical protein